MNSRRMLANSRCFQGKKAHFRIQGVFQDKTQIQGVFKACANPDIYIHLHDHCYELCKAPRALGIERCIRCSLLVLLLLLLLLLLFILLFVFDVNLLFRDGTLPPILPVHCTALSGVHSVAS